MITIFSPVQTSPLGDGRIDNFIIDSSVHVAVGIVVLVTLTITLALVGRHAARNEGISGWARASVGVAAAALAVQILLGIKLLDQGQGIVQLYIHYVGGMIPMAVFAVAGWVARGDTGRSSRVLTVLLAVGYLSALMAFFIGRAYANGG